MEEYDNPMTDIVIGVDAHSASKLMEGCRPTLSAISFARTLHATPSDESDIVTLMSVKFHRLNL